MMLWLFIFGLAVDIFFSGRLGQTSLILLLAAALSRLKDFLPKKIDRNIKLK